MVVLLADKMAVMKVWTDDLMVVWMVVMMVDSVEKKAVVGG